MFVLTYLRVVASVGLYVFVLDAETLQSCTNNRTSSKNMQFGFFSGDKRNNGIKMFSCGIVSTSLRAWN